MKRAILGDIQRQALESLQVYGGYWPGCGWLINTRLRTVQVMESLAKKELAVNTGTKEKPDYKITPYGQWVLSQYNPAQWFHLRKCYELKT